MCTVQGCRLVAMLVLVELTSSLLKVSVQDVIVQYFNGLNGGSDVLQRTVKLT